MSFDAAVAEGLRPMLQDKVAIITGGEHGIGRVAAGLFVEAGPSSSRATSIRPR